MLVLSMLLMSQNMSYSLVISATTLSICLYSVVDADVGIDARQLDYLCYFVDNYDYFVKKSCLYAVFITTFFIIIMILYFILNKE